MAPLPLGLSGLNHVSRICGDVAASARFYSEVLGFMSIKRPSSFDFEGAWLCGFGLGIHLIKGQPVAKSPVINPRAEHLSFQAPCLRAVEAQLQALGVQYVRALVEEDGIQVSQLFFHDPDNNMIEVCDCHLLPVIPLADIGAAFCTPTSCKEEEEHDLPSDQCAMSTSSSDPDLSASSSTCGDLMSFCADSFESFTVALHKSSSARCGRKGSSGSLPRSKSLGSFCGMTAQQG